MNAGKRFSTFAAMLLCSLLLVSCARNTNETAKNRDGSAQAEAASGYDSAASSANTPTLKTRSAQQTVSNSGDAVTESAALVIPAGTPITVRLQNSVSSRYSVPGQPFEAVLDQPIVVDNEVVVPTGSLITGHVTSARRSGRLRHPGEIALTLDSVTIGQRRVLVETSSVVARGGSHKKRNLAWIGGGTGGGALIGALAAGGKGALIGSGIGAAAGTTTAFLTGKKDVGFSAERRLRFRLNREVSLAG